MSRQERDYRYNHSAKGRARYKRYDGSHKGYMRRLNQDIRRKRGRLGIAFADIESKRAAIYLDRYGN